MVNKVILLGNLGRDPEVRTTASGQVVASLTLATSRHWKDKSGQKQEQTEWHNLVAWGKTAEICGQYLSKGSKVYIEGRLQTRSWDDKNSGEKKYRTEIVVDHLTMLGDKREAGEDRAPAPRSGPPAGWATSETDYAYPEGTDDDIPFSFLLGAPLAGLFSLLHLGGLLA